MKTKIAKNILRHAKPVRKVTRGKKQAHGVASTNKKETLQDVATKPEIIEAIFEAPVQFVEVDLEPVVEMFEVFEVAVPGDKYEA